MENICGEISIQFGNYSLVWVLMGISSRREMIVRIAKHCSECKVREVKSPYKLLTCSIETQFTWSMRYLCTGCIEKWDWKSCCWWLCSQVLWEMMCYFSTSRDLRDNVWYEIKNSKVHLEFTDHLVQLLFTGGSVLVYWSWAGCWNLVLEGRQTPNIDSMYWQLCELGWIAHLSKT